METKLDYPAYSASRFDSHSKNVSRPNELGIVVVLAESISSFCVTLCGFFHDLNGQLRELWEALFDASHKCGTRSWNTYARSTDWSRVI